MKRKKLEISGTRTIMIIRRSKLNLGLPFMINTNNLPSDQCYMEYPDGSIRLVTMNRNRNDFEIIHELSSEEAGLIKKKYNLT